MPNNLIPSWGEKWWIFARRWIRRRLEFELRSRSWNSEKLSIIRLAHTKLQYLVFPGNYINFITGNSTNTSHCKQPNWCSYWLLKSQSTSNTQHVKVRWYNLRFHEIRTLVHVLFSGHNLIKPIEAAIYYKPVSIELMREWSDRLAL